MTKYRYSLDRVDETTWIVTDELQRNTPVAYLLMLTPCSGLFNRQLTLAKFNAADSGPREYHVFDSETYSTFLYVKEDRVETCIDDFMYILQHTQIENPVVMLLQFGGSINNQATTIELNIQTH